MEKNVCITCGKSKSLLECGLCHVAVCKSCAQILEADAFSYLKSIPEELSHQTYCHQCLDAHVSSALAEYQQTLSQANEVLVFTVDQGKETRLIKRTEKPISVNNCSDEREVMLRLAFSAVQNKFNALVDVDIKSQKAGKGSYKYHVWSGTGIPAHMTERQIVKDRSIWQNPN